MFETVFYRYRTESETTRTPAINEFSYMLGELRDAAKLQAFILSALQGRPRIPEAEYYAALNRELMDLNTVILI